MPSGTRQAATASASRNARYTAGRGALTWPDIRVVYIRPCYDSRSFTPGSRRANLSALKESQGVVGLNSFAMGLLVEAGAPFLVAQGTPVAVPGLEPLAVALAGIVGRAEDRLQVGLRGPVRGDDGQLRGFDRLRRRFVPHESTLPSVPDDPIPG